MEKNLTAALSVRSHSIHHFYFKNMREFTMGRILEIVSYARSLFPKTTCCSDTWRFTMERTPTAVISVQNGSQG
jgi:hypothetical protein